MATETITASTLFNSFAVFREILQGISAFTSIFPKAEFDENTRYYEDDPHPKGRNFSGYPLIVIKSEMEDKILTLKDKKQMMYTTEVMIYSDSDVEGTTPRINSYMNAIVNYFNSNRDTLRNDYGLFKFKISKERDQEIIADKEFVVGKLTFEYHATLNVGS